MYHEGRELKKDGGKTPKPTRRLGVLGNLVWDRVFHPGEDTPWEGWGGLAYSMEAFAASLPDDWEAVPILKIGGDRAGDAREYLGRIGVVGTLSGVVESPFGAVTVERSYGQGWRRQERIFGTELPWTKEELAQFWPGLDALYLNFITGFELGLETALSLKSASSIPLYADLHSLFLDKDDDGRRSLKPLPRFRDWVRAFDIVQMNEEEFGTLGPFPNDARAEAERLLGTGVKLIAVTLGARGAEYLGAEGFDLDPGVRSSFGTDDSGIRSVLNGRIPAGRVSSSGDPSGCGDVWGATFFSRLLAGDSLETAAVEANRLAARKLEYWGAPGLRHHLSA
jgi:sugar/nucleoside kinase (ribokinase family)